MDMDMDMDDTHQQAPAAAAVAVASRHGHEAGASIPPSSSSCSGSGSGSDTTVASASSDVTQDDLDPISSHHYHSYGRSHRHAHTPRHLSLHAAPKQDSSTSTSQPQTSPRNVPHARSQTVDAFPSRPPPTPLTGRIKRKPLSSTASPLAIRFSSGSSVVQSPIDLPKPDQRFARPFTVDSPTIYEFSSDIRGATSSSTIQTLKSRDTHRDSVQQADPPEERNLPNQGVPNQDDNRLNLTAVAASPSETSDVLSGYDDLISDLKSDSALDATPETLFEDQDRDSDNDKQSIEPESDGYDYNYGYDSDESNDSDARKQEAPPPSNDSVNSNCNSNSSPPMFAPKPPPPHLKLEPVDTSLPPQELQSPAQIETPRSAQSGASPQLNKPLPKSPGQSSPFAALFSWAVPSPSGTEFSSLESPVSPSKNGTTNETPYSTATNSVLGGTKANAGVSTNALGYRESHLSTTTTTAAQIEEMEDDLKAISAELASSIRREMDLEDLVDRLQEQISNPQAPGKRTSDYFSDSGYSSAKVSDYDQSREEVGKIQRRSEQEKASLRLELTTKLQDERARRKELDQQIKELAEKASKIDLAEIKNLDANDRVKELENTCEDLRRRLSEERTAKSSFEDLLSALKGELQSTSNERDNLRDEIVPQLRARVEGLEAEAAEYANLTYESTKMQQQLQSLQKENDTLRHSAKSGAETPPNRMSRAMSGGFGGLSRSNSVATGSFRSQRPPNIGLSRSNSVKNTPVESREVLAERLKDVEAQRDALHGALKNLLERQEFQNRENEKRIRVLEAERERLISTSPRKGGFEREISNLRTEINVLRRRAEDALEQKWQVENGLLGLKMDLDRAEEEIAMLRSLLSENDILIPPSMARASASSTASGAQGSLSTPVTSESLENAYKQLQASYSEALERIKKLEEETGSVASDEKTQLAMDRLERSLAAAVSERDAAKQEVEALQSRVDDLAASEGKSLESERVLADELSESARRVEELAAQVRQQLSANADLRQRLAATVARGESDRKANSDRIADLQVRLKSLEEQLIAAQTASEERVARHEEEINALREAHNAQLSRMGGSPSLGGLRSPGLRSPGLKSPRNPLLSPMASPMFPRSPRSPRLLPVKSFEDEAQMNILRDRVTELETALTDAESEMQDVVARMSAAQIEVLNLQEEREAAVRETRRLQKILEQEQVKSFEERFRTLNGGV